jgi:GGDEF domain-containing protein/DNA-binding NarL/FixJ family response regulator
VFPTDRFERVDDDEVVEETELPQVRQLRMLVLEAAPHLAAAQAAITAAGHVVVIGATGRDGFDKLRPAIGDVDAVLVGLPGGEPLIDAALARGADRPVVIAASTSSAVEAVRRAVASGADLAAVRPHDVERLAPLLLAAGRMAAQRRPVTAPAPDAALDGALAELSEPEPEPATLQPFEVFQHAFERELERSRRYGYPLAVAMFGVDPAAAAPPPGMRGILRARAGNALVHAIRDIDLATELERDRFLVLLPHTDRLAAAELARRIIGAVAAGDPVIAGGRMFAPKVIGAVVGARPGETAALSQLMHEAAQLLEQAQATGASLAVET